MITDRLPYDWHWLDVALGVALVTVALNAARRGFVREAGTLLGLAVGITLAGRLASSVAELWTRQFGRPPFAQELAYLLVVLLTVGAIGGVAGLARSLVHLPGLSLVDGVAGLALGVVEGAAGIGLLLSLATRSDAIGLGIGAFDGSTLAPILLRCWLAVSAALPPELVPSW